MKKTLRSTLALMALAGLGHQACAEAPAVTISGFGTGALTRTDTDQAEFIRNNQAAGVMDKWRTGVDSSFGLQATAKFNDWLSATGQGMVRKFATDNYGAELAWAFLRAKATDDFSFRVGRIGLPVYMVSDFRNVGYANTMIRAPIEVYRQVNIDYLDGVDMVYQHSFDDTTVTAQFGLGNSEVRNVGGNSAQFHKLTALHVVAENGPFTLRFGRTGTVFSVTDNAGLNGLRASLGKFGFASVADALKIEDTKGSFTSVGLGIDWRNLIVQSEYAQRRTESRSVMDTNSWYTMFGYRVNKFTPYYVHSTVKQVSERGFPGLPTAGPLAALSAAANGASKTGLQTTNAVGVRWDFYKSMDLKVQVDRVTPRDGAGSFIKAAPGFAGPVNVYAVGIDFVF